jgi:alpha/beta superfamily hydrolase
MFRQPFIIAIIIVILYTIVAGAKRRMLYYPDTKHFYPKPNQVNELFINNRNGDKLCAWHYPAGEGTKLILFAHGNAGNLTFRDNFMNEFRSHNVSFIFFDYRGFGKSTGHTTIDTTVKDTEDWYNYVVNILKYKKENIVIVGESIGSYPAAKLAAKYNLDKLVILYGLHSLALTMRYMIPIIYPLIYILIFRDLRVGDILKKYKGHTLILHSKTDEIIQYDNAIQNSKMNDNIKLVEITGGHNTPKIDWEILINFIKE